LAERPPIQNLINALHERNLFPAAKAIAQLHHVTVEELLSISRAKQFVKARHALVALLVHDKGMGHNLVGKIMGMDHSSVTYAAKATRVDRSPQ